MITVTNPNRTLTWEIYGKSSDAKPTEDVDELILKVIDAPTKKEKRKADREAR